jgi:ATP-dependent DNA helicase DinG
MIGFQNEIEAESAPEQLFDLIMKTFSEGGWLQSVLGMEHRPQQETMAREVMGALNTDQPLLFEAGTGVGKSLAYLIPSILVAVHKKRQGIVATHTISLQEQIKDNDLKICRSLFAKVPELQPFLNFKVAFLVGKGNYLCTTRLDQAIAQKTELIPTDEQTELERIVQWSLDTKVGIRQELVPPPSFEVWDWVSADSSACNKKHCDPKVCHYQKARTKIRDAHILILNHSLLFSLLGSGMPVPQGRGVLYPEDFVILDEAHTVPAVATDHYGMGVSSYGVNRLLSFLYNPKRKKGLLRRHGTTGDCNLVVRVRNEADVFFSQVRQLFLEKREIARIYKPDWLDPTLLPQLRGLIIRIKEIAIHLDEGPEKSIVEDQRDRLTELYNTIRQFIAQSLEDQVYWVERGGRGGKTIYLRSAPIDISEYLKESLFMRETGVLLTSATLAAGPNMENFQKQVGAEKELAFQVTSPFDYDHNVQIFVAEDAPAPNVKDGRQDLDYMEEMILFCAEQVEGGTLVLFTNYYDLNQIARRIEPELENLGRSLFQQGRDYSRSELTREFAKAGNGVLLGTESFWAGVDVPGPALSQVIITRLPFENPSHPVAEAKSDWMKEQGKSPFMELTLPDALIKFRQGIGRLIRKKDDKGFITLLDSRVFSKQYGIQFLNTFPKRDYHRFNKGNRDWVFDSAQF